MKKTILFLIMSFSLMRVVTADSYGRMSDLLDYLEQAVAVHRMQNSVSIPIFAIAGGPGIGKTTFANVILAQLEERGITCKILHLDDVMYSMEKRKTVGTIWDWRHYNLDVMYGILDEILEGHKTITKPTNDVVTYARGMEVFDLIGIDLILFEGIYTLSSEDPINFFRYCFAGLFIEADLADHFNWRWEREQTKEHPRTFEAFSLYWKSIYEDCLNNVFPYEENATFILSKDSAHNYTLRKVK